LFNLDDTGQFDIAFSVWMHNSERDKLEIAKRAIEDGNTDGVDPAEVMKNALKNAPIKIVSPQDFVEGKALEE